MYFYMNDGVYEREWTYNLIRLKQKKVLRFSNYLEEDRKEKNIYFEFDDNENEISTEKLKKGFLLQNVTVKMKQNNAKYELSRCKECNKDREKNNVFFALLRSTTTVPDDVYIPRKMKENVEVIQRFRVIDGEADYGDFLSNIYFIKIKLNVGQSLSIFYTHTKPYVLKEHDVIYRQKLDDSTYEVIRGLKAHIIMDKQNRQDYISLSELYN